MNELVPDRRREYLNVSFAQKRLGQNDDGIKKPGGHGDRQRIRAKDFYRSGACSKLKLAAMNDLCDAVVRFDLSRATSNGSRSSPGLNEFEGAVEQKCEIDSEYRQANRLIYLEC